MDDKTAKNMGRIGLTVFVVMTLYGVLMREGFFIFTGLLFSAITWRELRKIP